MLKRKYGQWSAEDMNKAIKAYNNKKYGFNECCRRFGIPKPTLKRHIEGKIKRPLSSLKKNGSLTTLPQDVEKELVKHILHLEACMFGLSITDVRRLAFEIVEKNNLPHRFNKTTKLAGKKWFYSFIKRNPLLSVRQPENTSIARARGFNREAVDQFFNILQENVELHKIDITRIFNMDESGFTTVQTKCGKIIAQKGKKRIGRVVSGERGVNTTLVCCTSASGLFVPPMFIFKRKRLTPLLGRDVPPGSLVQISDSGYISNELFCKWLQHFIEYVKPTLEKKILLLLDGHASHCKNVDALQLAVANGVILLQLPGHTTHRLQPLDVGFFGPMQIYYNQALDDWMTCNAGQCISQYDVAPLISRAYYKAATVTNAVSSFKASGCWPVNRFVFNDADFEASRLLHNPQTAVEQNNNDESIVDEELNTFAEEEVNTESVLQIPIDKICSYPTVTEKPRTAQPATVLTSGDYLGKLEEKKKEIMLVEMKKQQKKQQQKVSKKKTNPKLENHGYALLNMPSTSASANISISLNEEEWFCSLCEEVQIENMIQCLKCSIWVHEACAGVSKNKKCYYCPQC